MSRIFEEEIFKFRLNYVEDYFRKIFEHFVTRWKSEFGIFSKRFNKIFQVAFESDFLKDLNKY